MRTSILHKGRLYEYEQQLEYNRHKQKMTQILRKKRNDFFYQEKNKKIKSQSAIILSASNNRIPSNQHQVKQQNNRLVKRLFEINRRKKFQILTSQQQQHQVIKLAQLHKKYSQVNRLRRQKQIQQENEKLVQKLLESRRQQSERMRQQYFSNDIDIMKSRLSQKSIKKRSLQKNNNIQKLKKYYNSNIDNYYQQQQNLYSKQKETKQGQLTDQQRQLLLPSQRQNEQIRTEKFQYKIVTKQNKYNQQNKYNEQNKQKRNHSTLVLPHVNSQISIPQFQTSNQIKQKHKPKIKTKQSNQTKTNSTINHTDILVMLQKYQKYKLSKTLTQKQKPQQQQQKIFSNNSQNQSIKQIQKQTNNPEQFSSIEKNKNNKNFKQLINSQLIQPQIPLQSSISYKPVLKFQNQKQKRANKKRVPIIKKVTEQNQYLNQQFQLDINHSLQQQQ